MLYSEFIPDRPLRDYIDSFWILESTRGLRDEYCLPDGHPLLLFNLGAPYRRTSVHPATNIQYPVACTLSNQGLGLVKIDHPGPVRLIGVRFQPYGLFPLLRTPMQEWMGAAVAAECLLGNEVTRLARQLSRCGSLRHGLPLLEQELRTCLAGALPVDAVVRAAVELMFRTRGEGRLSRFARQLNISKSTLEKKFQIQIGLSPKSFCNLIRFNSILCAYPRNGSLTQLAYSYGFYDQAHFNRNFRAFTGMSPRCFFRRPHRLLVMNRSCYGRKGIDDRRLSSLLDVRW